MSDLHTDAVEVLTGWRAPDPGQEAMREDFLGHLSRHQDGMWRACRPGHLTASTLVLSADRSRVLLTLHGKLKMWLQMGGHCEPGDATLAAAALREATEESGIAGLALSVAPVQLDRHPVPCHPEGSWHLDVQYLAVAPEGARYMISAESDDLRWFEVDALPDLTDTALRSLVARAALAG
ncbi:8-oxo-dGTP pyrophosphatase MutT (NUDIX family) [Actinocorallia herbida]|uniref:8-oxo-dGTP pyrophosphatase MutT (NUDIX family) n=1 Tax=Actinocorallia herbida TaxID=58109 RepID=A0A3N1CPA2_9ACTN|nr:NUDIX hydrolase [Actinocorallia herbida]ROO83141.1 8-oxo-dGTP pyrophosphatase MutT (NUDIX family) [Actinocorallia herbida]